MLFDNLRLETSFPISGCADLDISQFCCHRLGWQLAVMAVARLLVFGIMLGITQMGIQLSFHEFLNGVSKQILKCNMDVCSIVNAVRLDKGLKLLFRKHPHCVLLPLFVYLHSSLIQEFTRFILQHHNTQLKNAKFDKKTNPKGTFRVFCFFNCQRPGFTLTLTIK